MFGRRNARRAICQIHLHAFIIALLFALASVANAAEPTPQGAIMGDQAFAVVSPAWVAAHAHDPHIRILDVRGDIHTYLTSHVPNAIYLADSTMRAPLDGVPVQYLDASAMGNLFRRASVNDNDTVVIYSNGKDVLGATMVAYCLQRISHAKTRIVDGGYAVYAKKQPTTQAYPSVTGGDLHAKLNPSIFVTFDQLKKAMNDPNTMLVDARPAKAYAGKVKTWIRNGHIPGAINLDWHKLMNKKNPHLFATKQQMAKIAKDAGLNPSKNIIVYCGTSREASLEMLVLRHVLGYPHVRLYEGSWTAYVAHPDMPVAKGDRPLAKANP